MEYTRLLTYKGVIDYLKENNATRMDFIKNPSNGYDLHFELNNECKSAGTIDKRLQQDIRAEVQLNVNDVIVAIMTNQNGEVLYDLRYKADTKSDINDTTINLTQTDGNYEGKYPELFLSPLAYDCLSSYPPAPKMPARPDYIEPSSYQSEGRLLKGIYWLLAGILCPIGAAKSGESSFMIYFSLIVFNAIAIYYFVKHFKSKNAFIKYIEKENSIKEKRYQNQLTEYNWQIKRTKTEEYIKEYRRKMASCFFTRSISSGLIPCCDDDIVKKGPAEEFLANALKESYTILTDKKIRINRSFYYPDIVIVKGGMYIDVEIDEPYSNEGIPIHYQEDKGDKMRNEFFTENGWEVIRFSEKQVFNNTKECISFIGKYITSIQKCSSTISIDEAFIDPKCTRAEALSLAKLDYRSFYLPQSIRIGKGTPNDNATSLSSSDLDDLPF